VYVGGGVGPEGGKCQRRVHGAVFGQRCDDGDGAGDERGGSGQICHGKRDDQPVGRRNAVSVLCFGRDDHGESGPMGVDRIGGDGCAGLSANSGAPGSAISQVAAGDGTNDYDVKATVHLTNPLSASQLNYSVLARATPDAAIGSTYPPLFAQGTFYAFTLYSPWWDTPACSATMLLSKVVNGSMTVLSSFPYACHDGMTLELVARTVAGGGVQLIASVDAAPIVNTTDNSSPNRGGRPPDRRAVHGSVLGRGRGTDRHAERESEFLAAAVEAAIAGRVGHDVPAEL
jgi:hypothetical protein